MFVFSIGSVELASAGVSMNIFNYISKLFNIPLLSVATSFVAEDIAKTASKGSTIGEVEVLFISLVILSYINLVEDSYLI